MSCLSCCDTGTDAGGTAPDKPDRRCRCQAPSVADAALPADPTVAGWPVCESLHMHRAVSMWWWRT